ncbi:hypothetical protein CPARK_000025300 [cyanobacterium endosymbiont of Braarudosphaera bigelowii]|uniref:Uncharacterized protein n=2 Tax=Candidatus Atelocyanobacterium thalassae TaxID=713887 RepID=A0ABM7U3Z1_9CHRO|nr:hypothetical protein CPARK_000025300 [cyanobacterium endosymbiont of Braarudosphaera bigelowii]
MTLKIKILFILKCCCLGIFSMIPISRGYAAIVQKSEHLHTIIDSKHIPINIVKTNCPNSFEVLMTQLLHDLPSYSNRVAQRARRSNEKDTYSYIILAGKLELQPLPLTNFQYKSLLPDNTKQAFFTTLERHYSHERISIVENYYRVFVSKGDDGWRLVYLSSRPGHINTDSDLLLQVPLPPRNAINGTVGQGIRIWLRDCRIGNL